jgi:hypothetical protein
LPLRHSASSASNNGCSSRHAGVGLIRLIAQAAAAESVIQESLHALPLAVFMARLSSSPSLGSFCGSDLSRRIATSGNVQQVGGIGFVVASGSGSEKFGYYRRNPIAGGRQHRFPRSLAFPEILAGQERVDEVDELRPDLIPAESLLFPVPSVSEFFEASDDGALVFRLGIEKLR